MKRKINNYIPSIRLNDLERLDNFYKSYSLSRKVWINTIKIDKKRFSFNNPISQYTIDNIVNNFDLDFWDPIIISEDNFLLDWQHRLKACKILNIKYIDVIIDKNIY